MRGWAVVLVVLVAIAVAALGAWYAYYGAPRPSAGVYVNPETAAEPGYTATYNYTISVYAGQLEVGAYYNEFRVKVLSVDGDLVRIGYEQLVSANRPVSNPAQTVNYTYALVPSNISTYYSGIGVPIFLSSDVRPGSGGANTTIDGYNVTYKYVVTVSSGNTLVSSSITIYNGTSPVSASYWYFQYNGTTDMLEQAYGLLATQQYGYRFEYQMMDHGGS